VSKRTKSTGETDDACEERMTGEFPFERGEVEVRRPPNFWKYRKLGDIPRNREENHNLKLALREKTQPRSADWNVKRELAGGGKKSDGKKRDRTRKRVESDSRQSTSISRRKNKKLTREGQRQNSHAGIF